MDILEKETKKEWKGKLYTLKVNAKVREVIQKHVQTDGYIYFDGSTLLQKKICCQNFWWQNCKFELLGQASSQNV